MGVQGHPDAGRHGVENLQDMSVGELVEEFGVTRQQVQAVLEFAAQSAAAQAPRP